MICLRFWIVCPRTMTSLIKMISENYHNFLGTNVTPCSSLLYKINRMYESSFRNNTEIRETSALSWSSKVLEITYKCLIFSYNTKTGKENKSCYNYITNEMRAEDKKFLSCKFQTAHPYPSSIPPSLCYARSKWLGAFKILFI